METSTGEPGPASPPPLRLCPPPGASTKSRARTRRRAGVGSASVDSARFMALGEGWRFRVGSSAGGAGRGGPAPRSGGEGRLLEPRRGARHASAKPLSDGPTFGARADVS
eukprot:3792432-Alexandrium_andersonii.AAC.1